MTQRMTTRWLSERGKRQAWAGREAALKWWSRLAWVVDWEERRDKQGCPLALERRRCVRVARCPSNPSCASAFTLVNENSFKGGSDCIWNMLTGSAELDSVLLELSACFAFHVPCFGQKGWPKNAFEYLGIMSVRGALGTTGVYFRIYGSLLIIHVCQFSCSYTSTRLLCENTQIYPYRHPTKLNFFKARHDWWYLSHN